MLLDDQVVLVTGATGTLGRVATRRVAAAGARVALVGTDEARLNGVAAQLRLDPERWMPAPADLRDRDAAAAAVAAVERRFARVDVLLHLVGGWTGGTDVVDLDHDELRSMLDQHLWTTLNVVQAVVRGMVERGRGRILAVTSPVATNPGPRGASYAIAKAAEEVLLRSLAREAGDSGVTANLVVVRTIDAGQDPGGVPLRSRASTTAEEIADVLLFLASPAAAAVNGARIPLDGRG